jgi:DNA invertase Pin-like site-specific DNA recombinase
VRLERSSISEGRKDGRKEGRKEGRSKGEKKGAGAETEGQIPRTPLLSAFYSTNYNTYRLQRRISAINMWYQPHYKVGLEHWFRFCTA